MGAAAAGEGFSLPTSDGSIADVASAVTPSTRYRGSSPLVVIMEDSANDQMPRSGIPTSPRVEMRQLAKCIRDFDAEFLSTHGRKPAGRDRLPVAAQLRRYKLLKRQLTPGAEEAVSLAAPATTQPPSPLPLPIPPKDKRPPSSPLERMMATLQNLREADRRPEALEAMSATQLTAEKSDLKRLLAAHAADVAIGGDLRAHKESVRSVYTRYHEVRQRLEKMAGPASSSSDAAAPAAPAPVEPRPCPPAPVIETHSVDVPKSHPSCNLCMAELAPGQQFCGSCGAQLRLAPANTPPNNVVPLQERDAASLQVCPGSLILLPFSVFHAKIMDWT